MRLRVTHPTDWLGLLTGFSRQRLRRDVCMIAKLRRFSEDLLVRDYPSEIGCDVCSQIPQTSKCGAAIRCYASRLDAGRRLEVRRGGMGRDEGPLGGMGARRALRFCARDSTCGRPCIGPRATAPRSFAAGSASFRLPQWATRASGIPSPTWPLSVATNSWFRAARVFTSGTRRDETVRGRPRRRWRADTAAAFP